MVIDFNSIETTANPHFKGGEGEVLIQTAVADGKVKLMRITIPVGASIGLHPHYGNSEEILVLQGKGHFMTDGIREDICAGQAHYCEEGETHSFVNDGDEPVVFFAVVPDRSQAPEK